MSKRSPLWAQREQELKAWACNEPHSSADDLSPSEDNIEVIAQENYRHEEEMKSCFESATMPLRHLHLVYNRLTTAQFTTTSCNSFWSLLGTAQGQAIAMEWYNRLTAAQFTTTSCNSFWRLVRTAEGQAVAMEWYDRLTTAQFTTTSCNSFWSLVRTAEGQAVAMEWYMAKLLLHHYRRRVLLPPRRRTRARAEERFKLVVNGSFFAMLRRPEGAERITRMLDELDRVH
jgi:hypothetical protein